MGKFSLLTTLTLNATGYDKGINQAKRKTDELVKVTEGASKLIKGALSFAGVALSFEAVVSTLKKGLESTGEGADILAKRTMQVDSAVQTLGRSLVQHDFSNLARNIKSAMIAAGEYADKIDVIDQRTQDLRVRKSLLQSHIDELKAKKSEGKATKDEIGELKKLNDELYITEIELINATIDAKIKRGADEKRIDASLFANMQSAINKRAQLSQKEVEDLQNVSKEYDNIYNKLVNDNTTTQTSSMMGPGIGGGTTSTPVTDWTKVEEGINQYLATLTDVQKAQLLQDRIITDGEAGWESLIELFVKLNTVTSEYNSNIKQMNKASSEGKESAVRSGQESGISTSGSVIPSISVTSELSGKLAEHKNVVDNVAQSYENLQTVGQSVNQIFGALGATASDSTKAWLDFASTLFTEIPQLITALGVLSAANMTEAGSEAAKAGATAGSKAARQSSSWIQAVAQAIGATVAVVGGMMAAIKTTKFADGAVVNGATYAMIGEAGPEVVLNKMQLGGLVKELNGGGDYRLVGKLKGKDILIAAERAAKNRNANT